MTMQHLTLEETADFLETATIEFTRDVGHAIIHTGKTRYGYRFVLVNDFDGETVVTGG